MHSYGSIHQGIQVDSWPSSDSDIQWFLQKHYAHVENACAEPSDVEAAREFEIEREEEAGQDQAHLLVRKGLPDAIMWPFRERWGDVRQRCCKVETSDVPYENAASMPLLVLVCGPNPFGCHLSGTNSYKFRI